MSAAPLLEVSGLAVAYGHVEALQGIDFRIDAGEIRTLVGANGAGKSTTLLALSGLVAPRAGMIRFDGEDITRMAPHRIVERGLIHVAEGRAILTTLTVRENLELGAYRRRDKAAVASDLERVLSLFPRLKERIDGVAGNLSGGEQQMLAIGRALMGNPKFLMLDEPSLGIAPRLITTIFEKIVEINQNHGITILLVEQNANLALEISSYAYVLETGRIAMEGESKRLHADPQLKATYLGG